MSTRLRAVIISFGLLYLWMPPIYAAGETDFDTGVTLFSNAEYRSALTHFVAAEKAGMKEPKLYFNMGVCHYKLEQYSQAKSAFLRAAAFPSLRDLSYYNVGLVEQAQGGDAQAKKWFQQVYDNTHDDKLKRLAAAKLGRRTGASSTAEAKKWFAGYSLSVGYDDNIEDPALNGASGKGDNFANAMLYAGGVLQGSYNEGVRLMATGYLQKYQDVTIYDLSMLQLKLDKSFVIGSWKNVVGVGVEQMTLGSNDYLRTAKLRLSGEKKLSATDALRLRYRYSDIASLDTLYDKLEGSRHEAEIRWRRKLSNKRFQASYEYEVNDRKDYTGATTFSSYSPTRHTIELRTRLEPAPRWQLKGRFAYRNSTYADANILTGGAQVKREDDQGMVAVGVARKLGKTLKVNLDYKYTDNSSNISAYTYTRNIYSVGLSGSF